ncbi:MAG: terpene cyclase/mutase family protein [Anaerolineae bacterium]|nr:terpene cyclase/mutase family protein [Phycisphaerae bacterium]
MDKAQKFLVSQQQPDGGWQRADREPPGITALVVQGLAVDPNYGPSNAAVKKGFDKLLSYQQPDGGIYKDMLQTYNTAIAVSALSASDDAAAKAARDKAIEYLRKTQWAEGYVGPKGEEAKDKSNDFYGGWGYGRHSRPDLSNVHFAVQAVHDAGLKPGDKAYEAAMVFISRCQNLSETNDQPWAGNDGGFVYSAGNGGDSEAGEYVGPDGKKLWRSYGSMTYAGLKSMIYAGVSKTDPRVKAAVGWIQKRWTFDENPGMRDGDPTQAQHGLYYYYQVAAKALNAYDEPTITDEKGVAHDWRVELIDKLASLQKPDGSFAGEKRWMEDNPIIVTSYCVIALQEIQKDLAEHPAAPK